MESEGVDDGAKPFNEKTSVKPNDNLIDFNFMVIADVLPIQKKEKLTVSNIPQDPVFKAPFGCDTKSRKNDKFEVLICQTYMRQPSDLLINQLQEPSFLGVISPDISQQTPFVGCIIEATLITLMRGINWMMESLSKDS